MITSANKRLYDFMIAKLNENSFGVTFDGNFIFKFWQQGSGYQEFEILYKDPDSADDIHYLTKEVVPVVDVQTIEIPYVEKNIRADYEKELYFTIRVESKVNEFNQRIIEFDDADEKYQAVLEVLDNIRNTLTYQDGDYRYTFKVKEPQKVNVFKYSGDYYQIFSLNFNLSSVQNGFFGNEMKFYLGQTQSQTTNNDFVLDNVEANIIMAKETRPVGPFTTGDSQEQKTFVNSRNWQLHITVNYRNNTVDNLIWNELHSQSAVRQPYELRVVQGSLDYTFRVFITNANAVIRNNSIEQIHFVAERE